MSAKRPTQEQVARAADVLGLPLDEADLQEFTGMIGDTVETYYRPLDRMIDTGAEIRYPRVPGYRPGPEEDPLGAWYRKTEIQGAARGKLRGRSVVIKDNICIAGVPLMNGASVLEGYTPDEDATVVTRVLDAGGTIPGKANCEYFCYSGSSHTNAIVTTLNPYNHAYTTGGSSSGCAALVAAGEVDMAIGSDQGGSVREPSAFCGLYGLKPTFGLIPYTGALSIEMTLDHLGPMTRSTEDNALLLEVLAGPDGLDPRQGGAKVAPYRKALDQGVDGLRIGVVAEGFGHSDSEADVDAAVREAAARLGELGAEISDVSIPAHRDGMAIWTAIAVEGAYEQMLKGMGVGHNWRGRYNKSQLQAVAGWRGKSHMWSEIVKLAMLCAEVMRTDHYGRYYAKAQNLNLGLRSAYDAALDGYDLLLMPTTPIKGVKLPGEPRDRAEDMTPGFVPIANTAPLDCSGHPAMNVPCAMREGLPIGMMLIGKWWDEMTIYRASAAFERAFDWKSC